MPQILDITALYSQQREANKPLSFSFFRGRSTSISSSNTTHSFKYRDVLFVKKSIFCDI